MKSTSKLLLVAAGVGWLLQAPPAHAQEVYPPGSFTVDGFPVQCGPVTFILTPQLQDVGMADGQGRIFLNPMMFQGLPTPLKLYWVAHECGHYQVGANEVAADCWTIRTGRNQGWFPPQAFNWLIMMFRNNPGDLAHPSGPQRVQNMIQCYQS